MPEAAEVELTKEQKMSKARNVAFAKLREAHTDEYNQYVSEEATKLGVAWAPKLTEEQKAAQMIAGLLTTYPNLAPVVAAELAGRTDDEPETPAE